MGFLRLGRLPGGGGPTGGAQSNTSSADLYGGALNAIDTGGQYSFGGGALPTQIDVNGYPNTTLTAGQTISFAIGFVNSQTGPTEQWLFKWNPPGDAVYYLSAGWSVVTSSGCSFTGSNSSNTVITMTAGTPCRAVFTWNINPGSNLSTQFRAASYAPGSPKMVLCRLSDEARVDAGQYFTQEYLDKWSGLSLRTIRTMPWNSSIVQAATIHSMWAYRTTPNCLGWKSGRYPPSVWAGASTGTNQYTVSLPTDSSAAGWVDGEVIQASIGNASTSSSISISGAANNGSGLIRLTVPSSATLSTSQQVYVSGVSGTIEANGVQTVTVIDATHIDLQGSTFTNTYQSSSGGLNVLTLTVTGKTGGTKFIATEGGHAPGVAFTSSTISTGLCTFVYDEILDVVKWVSGGITDSIPMEVQVSLANTLNVNLWTTIPTFATKTYDYAKSEAALIRDSLSSNLSWYVEYTNETWNSGFPQFALMINQGSILGISGNSMHSLRHRQMMDAISTVWAATGRSASNLVRVLAWQGFGDSSMVSHRLNSSQLTTASNAKLLAYTGSINYTTAGQRAIDYSDSGAYAVYVSGALFTNGFATAYQSDATAVTGIQNLADLFAANSSDATALAIVDNDFRQGTVKNVVISSIAGSAINATNTFTNNTVGVFTVDAGGSLYTGVSLNTSYFIVSATGSSFSVATTRNGTPISLSGGSGTIRFGKLADQTMMDLSRFVYQNVGGNTSTNPGWEQVAATYDAYRASVSRPILYIENYEGAPEAKAPTTTQCTLMGVTVGGSAAAASAALAAGLEVYKNSTAYQTLATDYLNQMMGRDPNQPLTYGLMAHSKTPSWFLLVGTSQWAMLPGLIDTTPYKSYDAVAAFH